MCSRRCTLLLGNDGRKLTAMWYGPQQAKLKTADSPGFQLLNRTNWIRTLLISGYGVALAFALTMHMKTI